MIVSELWRYPVKAIRGESCSEVRIEPRGVELDRFYALVNGDGKIGSHKQTRRFVPMPGLYDYQAQGTADTTEVHCPDGQTRVVGDPTLDESFSQTVGQPVRVAAEAHTPHMDNGAVHIITTASMRWLAKHLPDSAIDARRFRPNIVIDCDGDTLIEQQWLGKTLQIGSALLQVTEPVDRCVMTTLALEDLPRDPRVLRTLVQLGDNQFGVYARVDRVGAVSVDDFVQIVDA